MMEPTDPELDLAAAVADADPIDWHRKEQDGVSIADGLKRIESIQGRFRSARPDGMADPYGSPKRWGHLLIEEPIGAGSFGIVYRAHDPVLRRKVALKLRTESTSTEARGAFIAEARRLARVRHPNVMAVYGADVHDGRAGLWADLLTGSTLEDRTRRRGVVRDRPHPRSAGAAG